MLELYHRAFQRRLMALNSFLMVIGYSFGDVHINSVIIAAANNGLKLFIVDPSGVDVIDKRNSRAHIAEPTSPMMEALIPGIIGASRRPLAEIISRGSVENEKVLRFFETQTPMIRLSR